MKPTNFLRSAPTNVRIRVAFVNGLGAAAQSRPEDLDPEAVETARQEVAYGVETLESQIAQIEEGVKTAVFSFGDGGRFNLETNRQLARGWISVANELANFGTVAGRTAKPADYERVMKGLATVASNYAQAASDYNARFGNRVMSDIIVGTIQTLAQDLAQIGRDIAKFLTGVGSIVGGTGDGLKTTGDLIGFLPWIIGAIVVGPMLLKGASAARSGGDVYAAVGGELESARGGLMRGAQAAGRFARARVGV